MAVSSEASISEVARVSSVASSGSIEPALGAHIPVLDGVRGIAILVVMFYHMTLIDGHGWIDRNYLNVMNLGWVGVDLFFVLSGFLITGILFDSKGGDHYFRNFYAHRTLRIFPLYYAVVFFCLIILPHFHHAKSFRFARINGSEIWYWLYLSNYSIGYYNAFRHGILDVSWSLAIEEQFYLIWPAVVLFLDRRTLMKVCVALMVIALGSRLWVVHDWTFWIRPYVLTPCRMDSLAAGALVALAVRGPRSAKVLIRPACIITVIMALIAVGMKIAAPADCETPLWERYSSTVLGWMFAGALLLAITRPATGWIGRILASEPLKMFGRYSYALYLFHMPLRALVRDTFYGPERFLTLWGSQLPGQFIFYGIGIGISLSAALLSWNLYEKHFLKLKRLFPSKASAPKKLPIIEWKPEPVAMN